MQYYITNVIKNIGKISLDGLKPILFELGIIPKHQYGFCEKAFHEEYSTIEQAHRVVNEITMALEIIEICAAGILVIQQAFDIYIYICKIKKLLPY